MPRTFLGEWFDDFTGAIDRTFTGSDADQREREAADAEIAKTEKQRQREAAEKTWADLGANIPSQESQQWVSVDAPTAYASTNAEHAAADVDSIREQRRAMDQLGDVYGNYRDIYSHGGMTDADRARQQQSQMEQKRFERGQIEAQMQQASTRGMLGGGGELLGRFSAQQEGANRANAQGLGIEQLAEQRAMSALGGMGQTSQVQGGLAGQQREQSFEEAFRRAQARDQRDVFNTGIRGQNVDRRNEAQRHNAGLGQQEFQNRTTVAAGSTGQYNTNADANAQSQREQREREASRAAANRGMARAIIGAFTGSGGGGGDGED